MSSYVFKALLTLADERETEKFQDLNRSIRACDAILKSVEAYLTAFQNDLGTVSTEIETLQNRSTGLSRKLENRKAAEQRLGPIVEDIAIAPVTVRKITDGDVNDTWMKALREVDTKAKSMELRSDSSIRAIKDIKPEIDKLITKVGPQHLEWKIIADISRPSSGLENTLLRVLSH